MMDYYYRDFFPFDALEKWLAPELDHRTWAFQYRDQNGQLQLHRKNISFKKWNTFRRQVCTALPECIHLGGIDMPTLGIEEKRTLSREFVLDIDMSDYADIRTCNCAQKQACDTCWRQIAIPLSRCIYNAIAEYFTPEYAAHHVSFIFSGRRGFHAIFHTLFLNTVNQRTNVLKYIQDHVNARFTYGCRLDRSVTTESHHLIKLPYAVHAESKNVSIAFDPMKENDLSSLIIPVADLVNRESDCIDRFHASLSHFHVQE